MRDSIAEQLYKQGYISNNEIATVMYGFNYLKINFIAFMTILGLGVFFGKVLESIGFGIMTFALRKNAGGIHAKTKGQCMLMSTLILLLWFLLFWGIQWTKWACIIAVCFSIVILWKFAPMGNLKKNLDKQEIKIYRYRTRKIMIVQSIFFIFAYLWSWERLLIVVTMSLTICAGLLVLGKIQLLIRAPKK